MQGDTPESREKMNSEKRGDRTLRVLLVQACHPPLWLYLWDQLEKLHPDWEIQGLALDHPDVRFYLRRDVRPRRVHFATPPSGAAYDWILVPELQGGYFRLRRQAVRLKGNFGRVDGLGQVVAASRWQVVAGAFRRPQPLPAEAAAYLKRFPPFPWGERVVMVPSYPPEQEKAAQQALQRLVPADVETVTLPQESRSAERSAYRSFDTAVVFLTGDKGFWRAKWWAWWLPVRRRVAVNEHGEAFVLNFRTAISFLVRRFRFGRPLPRSGARVFVIQTEGPEYVRAALDRLRSANLFPEARVLLCCREEDAPDLEDHPSVARVVTFSRRRARKDLRRLRREIKTFRPHVNAALFTGRPVFRKQKLAFLILGSRRRFVFNAALDGYWLTWRSWPRLFRREPLLFAPPARREAVRILLVQTESVEYTRAALARLRSEKLYPKARIYLLCRPEDRAAFRGLLGVVLTLPFPRRGEPRRRRILRFLRRRGFEAKVAVFTGRRVFVPARLFFLSPWVRRPALVFNAALDAYWLTWRTWPRLFRREPVLFGSEQQNRHRVLLLESAEFEKMAKAVAVARQPHVLPNPEVTVLCGPERAELYRDLPGVDRVVSYSDSWMKNLILVGKLAKTPSDVVAAVFTGRRIFWKQKLLFWLLPAHGRLAFNPAMDCRYVSRRRPAFTWRHDSERRATQALEELCLTLVRTFLFLPRFAYLLAWRRLQRTPRTG
ncbi:MAG: hypothetical protein Kow00109_26800 [Acidobacteriota bacterium]